MATQQKTSRAPHAILLGLIFLLMTGYPGTINAEPEVDLVVGQPDAIAATLPEMDEYASVVLGDPWDMDQSTDLDFFYPYESNLEGSSFANGVYSARLTGGDGRERITLLTAGAQVHEAMRIGRIGYNYPIDANRYRYLSFRMYSSVAGCSSGLVQWAADDSQSSAAMGVSNSYLVPPLPCSGLAPGWYTYVLDLKTIGIQLGGTPWSGSIRELLLHPFAGPHAAGATVKLDWARLTAADPRMARPYTVQWTGNATGGPVTLYASPNDMSLDLNSDILIATNQSASGSYVFQTGVIPAGRYYIAAKNNNGVVWSQAPLIINGFSRIKITKPSMSSGPEYGALVNRNAWDMNESTDLNDRVDWPLQTCVTNPNYHNGTYSADVPLPVCPAGGSGADPIMFLGYMNRHGPGTMDPVVDTNKYRYLTYRFRKSGNNFSMMRFGWWQINATDNGVNQPPVMSRDILIIDGWHTYEIDLWADDVVDETYPPGTPSWRQSQPNRLRLDPTELLAQYLPVTVELDWIKLTAMDTVARGAQFPIEYSVNSGQPKTITFYYDTDTNPAGRVLIGSKSVSSESEPGQTGAGMDGMDAEANIPQMPDLTRRHYLPLVYRDFIICSGNCYVWRTSSAMQPGAYYVCASVQDDHNSSYQCSEAPVVVTQ